MGMVLPSFAEEYTGKEMIDIVGTLNEDFIFDNIPIKIDSSSISISEDGILSININAGA